MRPHSINETRFYFYEKFSHHLFYFKRENKTRKKTLKKSDYNFWKSVSLKNPSLGLGIRLHIKKVPLKDSIPLNPTKVSTN